MPHRKHIRKNNPLTFLRKIMANFVRITEKTEIYRQAKCIGVIEGGTYNYHRASSGYYTVNHNDHKTVL